jgi:hypothetical protein
MSIELENLYNAYSGVTAQAITEHDPLAVAAVLMTQALSLYKTILDPASYDEMVDAISSRRDEVKPFTNMESLH